MKYKVTNKSEHPVRCGKIEFRPKETKIMEVKPSSDRFHVEELKEEEQEKPKKLKGGK